MKDNSTKWMLGAALLIGALLGRFAFVLPPAHAQTTVAVPAGNSIGRYTLFESKSLNETLLLDTATGRIQIASFVYGKDGSTKNVLLDFVTDGQGNTSGQIAPPAPPPAKR